MTEKAIKDTLENWNYYKRRIKQLNEMLEEKTFKITATMTADKVMSGCNEVSKIEAFCFSRIKIIDERDEIVRKMRFCIEAYKNLLPFEKEVIKAVMKKESLLQIAKQRNIPQAKIYRIRDRTIRKMCKTTQNVVQN